MGTSIPPGEQERQAQTGAGFGPQAPAPASAATAADGDVEAQDLVPPRLEAAHEEPPLGVTLDLFEDDAPAGPPSGAARHPPRSRSRARRNTAAAQRAPEAGPGSAPAATFKAPTCEAAMPAFPSGPRAVPVHDAAGPPESLRRAVEQALLALPSEQLQAVVGQVAGTIVRSAEFQVALRAQLYTLVAPAITQALREALTLQEIRQSLRDTFLPGAAALPAALTREPLPHGATPQPAPPGPPPLDLDPPAGNAVLLIGYEPALARHYKAALAEAGYEAVIVEIGPNDQALPVEAYPCAIACLPDDVVEHVESVVSRHPFRQVLHLSATVRRLVEAVELALPLPQAQD